jgi:hypothetical protein
MPHLLGFALNWEPELRGLFIVLLAAAILPGSVYLLLTTNLGARLGFLIAAAGLFGWMTVMALVWTVYGIGLKGPAAVWKAQATVAGNVDTSTNAVLDGFPKGWHSLALDSAEAAEATAAADPVLAPPASSGQPGIFASSSAYIAVHAFEKGGERYFPGWNHPPDFLGIKHKPHYLTLQVQGVVKQVTVPGQAPPKAQADPSAPVVTVLMVRDLGALRQPSAVVALFSGVLFVLLVWTLHRRDKEAWAKRQEVART